MEDFIICFDIGGTRIKYGLVNLQGNLLHQGNVASNAHLGAKALYTTLVGLLEKLIHGNNGKLIGIGLALSGGIDPEKGVVLLPGKFKDLEGFPIVPLLREHFNVPVYADNDGRLAAYAEKYFGKALNVDWAVVLTIGTGIGSGVILDGKILYDPNLQFGTQIGHLIIDRSLDEVCLTGNKGTGEVLCSATALTLLVKSCIQRGIPSVLSDAYFEDPTEINFEKIIEACREGDDLCIRQLNVWVKRLSALLINAVHCYGPQKIILSGGATLAADLFLDTLIMLVNRTVFRYPTQEPIPIEVSDIREYAGVLGAAAMMMLKLNRMDYDRVG